MGEILGRGYDYDDVEVIPVVSDDISSRNDVDLELDFPIIASPMKGIISPDLILEISRYGGMGVLHRFYTDQQERFDDIHKVSSSNFGISVGIDWDKDESDLYAIELALAYNAKVIIIDVANGYIRPVRFSVQKLYHYLDLYKKYNSIYNTTKIMAGNVVTYEGAKKLHKAHADLIRVGIGSGQQCSTSSVTGIGMPQITALLNCNKFPIVCDGGIRGPADIVKALVAGAKYVMIGTAFARCFESSNNGVIYGMASKKLQYEYYSNVKSVEGKESEVKKDISARELLEDWIWKIKSAGTYLGATSPSEFRYKGNFVVVR